MVRFTSGRCRPTPGRPTRERGRTKWGLPGTIEVVKRFTTVWTTRWRGKTKSSLRRKTHVLQCGIDAQLAVERSIRASLGLREGGARVKDMTKRSVIPSA